MELVSYAKEVLQNAAEHAASYRVGQTVLRFLDRALWTIEKSARWAVPPPLDQEERPQPELIRPLPWVLFFGLLIVLRITRESISVVNLMRGKPPLRSADVVTYIQSKRRYLRTLKYQGNRMMRARTEPATHESWYSHLLSQFKFTMCFRRQHYGNNNTQLSNDDEVLVVKRSKRGNKQLSLVAATSETSMERLIEKMMADIEDSDECSDTFTNTNTRSEKSEYHTESDQDVANGSTCELDQETDINNEKFANTSIDNIDNETSEELYQMNSEIIYTKSKPKDETFNFLLHEVYPHRDGASIHIKISNGRAAKEKNLSIEESLSDVEPQIH